VSIDGATHALPPPFFVVATQNPEEFYGTYPLPESQLDRFILRLRIGYPAPEVERAVLMRRRGSDPVDALEAVVNREELLAAQAAVDDVRAEEPFIDYVHELVLATRNSPLLELGASTRAAIAFERAARAHALVAGRDFATPDDAKKIAVAALAHRVRGKGALEAASSRADTERVIQDILSRVPIPM
jgi:MoxR-like ATPase